MRSVSRIACFGLALTTSGCALFWGFERPEPRPTSDAGLDAEPEADAPPAYVPPAVLWLDAADGVQTANGLVVRWVDRSGHGNDALQADPSLRPMGVAAGAGRRAGVRFGAGTHLLIEDSATLRFGVGDFYFAVVVAYTGTPSVDETDGYSLVYSKQNVNGPYTGVALFANYVVPTPSSAIGGQVDNVTWARTTTVGLNDGKVHVFALHRSEASTSLVARLNGVVEASYQDPAVLTNVDAPGRPAYLGAQPVLGQMIQRLQGTIYEVIALAPPVTTAAIQETEAYLIAKYK